MAHVDALSRVTVPDENVQSVDAELAQRLEVVVALSATDRTRFMQQADDHTKNIIRLLQTEEELTKLEMNMIRGFELYDGLLYRQHNGRSLLVVPKSMRKGIVIGAHDYGGHSSTDRALARITTDYWFSGMRRYVRQHIKMCLDCLVHKKPAGRVPGLLHPIPPGKRPFQIIHVDHLGPFETSTRNNKYLLVIADNLTKYIHLYPCKTTNTAGVIRVLTKFCNDRGVPDRLISDRGSCFTARTFQEFCQQKRIKHTLNSTRHPQENGQVERANRTILPILSMSTEDQRHWDTKIDEIQQMLNTAVNKTTTKSPFEILHGYQPRFHNGSLRTLSRTTDEWVDPSQ